jgi:hypothetical protein
MTKAKRFPWLVGNYMPAGFPYNKGGEDKQENYAGSAF